MLKFIALSGTTEVTENLYVYEYGNDMIVVDCGVGFPDSEMYGIDLVIPDFSYIEKNKSKLRGIIVTHGHEDHLGAVPFLLNKVKTPVYSTKLVSGFIEEKLKDYRIKNADLRVFNPEKDSIALGIFKITPFRTSHSVPDSVGLCIDTPVGKTFHVPDYKFDWTPVDGKPFDIAKLSQLASQGALLLASDCLGSTTPGYTESEFAIEEKIETISRDAKGTLFFTTISSNISRMQQALNVAKRLGRKAAFVGRSIVSKAEIAEKLGYLTYPENTVVDKKEAAKISRNRLMYIISGCYGQPGSNLYRVALGEHESIKINSGDTVIFSADPAPPGTKTNVDYIVDKLIESDVNVHYYDIQEDLHVSGHGSQEDIKMLFAVVKPEYFVPIGGTIRHMRAYKNLARKMGSESGRIFELSPGDILELSEGRAVKTGNIPVKSVLVDGLGVGDVGKIVLRDRHILSKEGVVIALFQVDANKSLFVDRPQLISRGFVFQGKGNEILEAAADDYVRSLKGKRIDKHTIRNSSIDFLEKYFFKKIGRRPMILPVIVEI